MTPASGTQLADRPTRFIGVERCRGWQLKHYEITLDGLEVAGEIRDAVGAVVDAHLAGSPHEPSVGFVILHAGTDAVWMLVDLWQNELLYQALFRAALDTPTNFEPVGSDGPVGCVWELRVISHERGAYVRSKHEPDEPAKATAYLSDTDGAVVPSLGDLPQCNHRVTLTAFAERWDAGDVDGVMDLFSEDPVYRASTGSGPGSVHRGRDDVRAAIERVMAAESAHGTPPQAEQTILVEGDRAISTWAYQGQGPAGEPCLIEGVDLWTFEGGRIAIKDAYRKAFPDRCERGELA